MLAHFSKMSDEEVPLAHPTNLPPYKAKGFLLSIRSFYIATGIVVVVIGSVILSFGVLAGALSARSTSSGDVCSNPPLLLISLDGFWDEYFNRSQSIPYLRNLSSNGVRAKFMKSVFPTETFPSHYSIVTGLYPESHGIIGRAFYDRVLDRNFTYRNSNVANDPVWWFGEPIWVTAAKYFLKTGIYFWPGSEVPIQGIHPNYYFDYDRFRNSSFEERVNTVLQWLDRDASSRPQFMAMYFNEPDHSGHKYGPSSTQVNEALTKVDSTVRHLFEGLDSRGLTNCVNVIIVSDHGMTSSDLSKRISIRSLIPDNRRDDVTIIANTVTCHIYVNGGSSNIQEVYQALKSSENSGQPFSVYLKKDIPDRLHAGRFNTQRYGDIFVIGQLGSFIDISNSGNSFNPPIGVHGYDNNLEEMRAIFIAHGPAFKKNYVSDSFENIELYNLMCGLLNIKPAANSGTMGSLNHILQT